MEIRLNSTFVEGRISLLFKSKVRLLDQWGERYLDPPDRGTLYNWLSNRSSFRSFKKVLELSSLLEVDPVLLFEIADGDFAARFDQILRNILGGLPSVNPVSTTIFQTFGPRTDWPDNREILRVTGDRWNYQEFINLGVEAGHYQTLKIITSDDTGPLTFHIAYRGDQTNLWRVYGNFTVFEDTILLNNYFQGVIITSRETTSEILFSTYFGAGATNFRIACLKPFKVLFSDKCEESNRFYA